MIHSMTGFGAARREIAGLAVNVEARSVNGRFLKVAPRLPARLAARELEVEAAVKRRVRRGSLSLTVTVREQRPEALVSVNEDVVRAYQAVFRRLGVSEEPLAQLPGVLGAEPEPLGDEAFAVVLAAIDVALDDLVAMRRREGETLAATLVGLCDAMAAAAQAVRGRAPAVVGEFRQRLSERLGRLVDGFGSSPLDAQLLAREVAVLADRSDITEELDRFASHLEQVRALLARGDEAGRTLEFLTQELLREANTMGSKSADGEITRAVVGLKADIERFKEQIANVE